MRIQVGGFGKLNFVPAAWVAGAPYRFRLEKISDGKIASRGGGSLNEIILPPGKYRLIWQQSQHRVGPVALVPEIEIKPGSTTALQLNTGIHLVPADWIETPPYSWFLKDPASGRKMISVSETWDPVLVPAGTYELWYHQWQHGSGDMLLRPQVKIEPGKVTEVELNTGVVLKSSDPAARPPYRWVLTDPESKQALVSISERWGPVPVAPGRYGLSVRQTQHGHSLTELIPNFTVEPGQLVEIGL